MNDPHQQPIADLAAQALAGIVGGLPPKPMIRIPFHPLDHPGSIKILLGQTASELLASLGDWHVATISHPDATSPPEAAGRMILICSPMNRETAIDVGRVIVGSHVVKRIAKPATAALGGKKAVPAHTP